MSDAKYFQTTSKGEIAELKEELHHKQAPRKKEAVKKVIAAMTVGKDVSVLFADVINLMQTNDVELKKLVYLYLMNYAKSQPDLAILAVNTFVNDAKDPNPLIRALAVRTMGCIRVDKITEYLCEPLGQCLKDSDPYVRKTAAVCVAKLYDINAELVEDKGFIDTLKDMLGDANPMVVANTVAALSEIAETSGSNNVLPISTSNLQKLQAALNECTEWGQVFILDALAKYRPSTSREAEALVERVLPRLNHANSAVVLSAVKICIKFFDKIDNADFTRVLLRKLAPSLVTLLSREPEVQYVALRNINLVVQLKPAILQHEIKVFYCKYNDPVYVKLEKLEIMIRLASERNIDQVLMEFKEYATEVDVDFVRRSVRAIGRCAIKIEKAAERCINVLLGLIQTKVNYVVQEAIVVIKDIFRRYPDRYESIISTLCESLDRLDEPEAKASMIWIIGEYAGRIDNADELLDTFLDTFSDEPAEVQLQLLTATVKLFLKKPADNQEMVQRVLTTATQASDNPDLRDRGYLYWRLLSTDPEAAKKVVLADKPVITDGADTLPRQHLLELVANMSTLSSVFHKSPEAFVVRLRGRVRENQSDDEDGEDNHAGGGGYNDDDDNAGEDDSTPAEKAAAAAPVVDLLDLGLGGETSAPAAAAPAAGGGAGDDDLLGIFGGGGAAGGGATSSSPAADRVPLITAEKGRGMTLAGCFASRGGRTYLDLTFGNNTPAPLTGFAIQFNKNAFGVTPAEKIGLANLAPGATTNVTLPCSISAAHLKPATSTAVAAATVQMALMNNAGVLYFECPAPLHAFLTPAGRLDKKDFLERWRNVPDELEATTEFQGVINDNPDAVKTILEAVGMYHIARRDVNNQVVLYLSAAAESLGAVLLEVTLVPGSGRAKVCARCESAAVSAMAQASLQKLLCGSVGGGGQPAAAQPPQAQPPQAQPVSLI